MWKWLLSLFSCGDEDVVRICPPKEEDIPEIKLVIKKGKYGLRPYVIDTEDDNLVWMSPDWKKSEQECIDITEKYFCRLWRISK
jgi:hypothetical protein